MDRFLRPSLYAARAGRDLVLLDVVRGAYDLLAGAAESLSVDRSGRRLQVSDPALDAAMTQANLFVSKSEFQESPPLPLRPTRSVIGRDPQLRWRERRRFASAWSEMLVHYYGRDLPELLRHVKNVPSAARLNSEEIEQIARAFHQLSPWAPFAGDCVFRCFMLLRALQDAGTSDVRWVFGVRTWPFYAHCWLQTGELALTDHAEPLVSFIPIFATGP